MCAEDQEAQQIEKKRVAVEEKRNLAASKQCLEEDRDKRLLKMGLLEHESQQRLQQQQVVRDRLVSVAEKLWPPVFRALWTARCVAAHDAQVPGPFMGFKKTSSARLYKLTLSLQLCPNCVVPGHPVEQCPMPPEKVFRVWKIEDSVGADKKSDLHVGAGKAHQRRTKVCPICNAAGHVRIICPQLTAEQSMQYDGRLENLRALCDTIEQHSAVEEPPVISDAQSIEEAYSNVQCQVIDKVKVLLHELGFEPCFVVAPFNKAIDARAVLTSKAQAKTEQHDTRVMQSSFKDFAAQIEVQAVKVKGTVASCPKVRARVISHPKAKCRPRSKSIALSLDHIHVKEEEAVVGFAEHDSGSPPHGRNPAQPRAEIKKRAVIKNQKVTQTHASIYREQGPCPAIPVSSERAGAGKKTSKITKEIRFLDGSPLGAQDGDKCLTVPTARFKKRKASPEK
jgi:hypothetical protein